LIFFGVKKSRDRLEGGRRGHTSRVRRPSYFVVGSDRSLATESKIDARKALVGKGFRGFRSFR